MPSLRQKAKHAFICADTNGADMSGIFRGISGTIGMTCDPPASPAATVQSCSLDLTGLPISTLNLQCATSECRDPGATSDGGSGLSNTSA
jgi:hypothetical protein